MKQIVLKILFLGLIAHTCEAAIIIPTPNRERIDRVYEATIYILMRCYMESGNAIGVVGDSDGFIEKLWAKHSIPAVLIDSTMKPDSEVNDLHRRRLQAFVIVAATPEEFQELMYKLAVSIWANNHAKFLILSPTPDKSLPLSVIGHMFHIAYNNFGVLGAQFIQSYGNINVAIFDFSPYTNRSPKPWELLVAFATTPPFYMFIQSYRKEYQTCESLNFKKTLDLEGYPFTFMVSSPWVYCHLTNTCETSSSEEESGVENIDELLINQYKWFVDTITMAINATAVVTTQMYGGGWDISVIPGLYGDIGMALTSTEVIISNIETPLFAMTQHTPHMSQLEKILSVVDAPSRYGMYLIYAITFLFFKFFLGQAVVPAILNLVRLTCNTGLPTLPTNVAPIIYLTCLFVFVINFQAIYTGNLASLLTTTIAYPHVDTKEDIPRLGYTVYAYSFVYNKIAADPILDGRVIKINIGDPCEEYVLRDPLAACVGEYYELITLATQRKLHLSRNPIQHDYYYHMLSGNNPLAERVQEIVLTWHECGLRRFDDAYLKLQVELVDDDEVKKNTVRRAMNLTDLGFAFVILGIGVACSIVCFAVEVLVYHANSRFAKRRTRVRPVLDSGVGGINPSWFSALKLR